MRELNINYNLSREYILSKLNNLKHDKINTKTLLVDISRIMQSGINLKTLNLPRYNIINMVNLTNSKYIYLELGMSYNDINFLKKYENDIGFMKDLYDIYNNQFERKLQSNIYLNQILEKFIKDDSIDYLNLRDFKYKETKDLNILRDLVKDRDIQKEIYTNMNKEIIIKIKTSKLTELINFIPEIAPDIKFNIIGYFSKDVYILLSIPVDKVLSNLNSIEIFKKRNEYIDTFNLEKRLKCFYDEISFIYLSHGFNNI